MVSGKEASATARAGAGGRGAMAERREAIGRPFERIGHQERDELRQHQSPKAKTTRMRRSGRSPATYRARDRQGAQERALVRADEGLPGSAGGTRSGGMNELR